MTSVTDSLYAEETSKDDELPEDLFLVNHSSASTQASCLARDSSPFKMDDSAWDKSNPSLQNLTCTYDDDEPLNDTSYDPFDHVTKNGRAKAT